MLLSFNPVRTIRVFRFWVNQLLGVINAKSPSACGPTGFYEFSYERFLFAIKAYCVGSASEHDHKVNQTFDMCKLNLKLFFILVFFRLLSPLFFFQIKTDFLLYTPAT